MSTLGRKTRAAIWTRFSFDVKEDKTRETCGATVTGENYFSQLKQLQSNLL